MLYEVITPRWLLGRTWGDNSHDLKIEDDLDLELQKALVAKGHEIRTVPPCSELMGHAGAIAASAAGVEQVATDPRSDGAALQA